MDPANAPNLAGLLFMWRAPWSSRATKRAALHSLHAWSAALSCEVATVRSLSVYFSELCDNNTGGLSGDIVIAGHRGLYGDNLTQPACCCWARTETLPAADM